MTTLQEREVVSAQNDYISRLENLPQDLVDRAAARLRERSQIHKFVFRQGLPFEVHDYIAVHNTDLGQNNPYGQSLGGTRVIEAGTFDPEKLADELGRDMSRKFATELGMLEVENAPSYVRKSITGGGKSVAVVPSLEQFNNLDQTTRASIMRRHAYAIDQLGGEHITAVDMNTTVQDMDVVSLFTPYVACQSERRGGTGDPSPTTAVGVHSAAKASLEVRGIDPHTAYYSLQGVGKVGTALATEILTESPKARVIVNDKSDVAVKKFSEMIAENNWQRNVWVIDPKDFWKVDAHIYMPNGDAGVVNMSARDQVRYNKMAVAVCGAANYQYPVIDGEPDQKVIQAFHDIGITVVSAPLANLGGILHLSSGWWTYHGLDRPMTTAERDARTRELVKGNADIVRMLYEKTQPGVKGGITFEQAYLDFVARVYAQYCLENNMPLQEAA